MKSYADYVAGLGASNPELVKDIAAFTRIEHVLDWMKARTLGQCGIDMVSQDEFTSDFLVEMVEGGRWLSFRVT